MINNTNCDCFLTSGTLGGSVIFPLYFLEMSPPPLDVCTTRVAAWVLSKRRERVMCYKDMIVAAKLKKH
jgi:hypothetical protein